MIPLRLLAMVMLLADVGLLAACASTSTSSPPPGPAPSTEPAASVEQGAGSTSSTLTDAEARGEATAPASESTMGPAPGPATGAAGPAGSAEATLPGPSQQAADLVEQGRRVQQEQGEGGAMAASELYQRALALDPSCAAAHWELGWSQQVAGNLDAAVAAWMRLRELQPDYPELAAHLPVLLMRRDQAAALAALPETGPLPPPEEEPRSGPSLTLHAVGDVHLGRGWPESRATLPADDAREVFVEIQEVLGQADLTFGNLETALADTGDSVKCGPKSTKCFAFRVPTAFANGLAAAGFDVMSIANNHAGDFGPEGRRTTMEALDRVGIKHSGPLGDIASLKVNGLRVGLIAFSTGADVYRVQELELARKVVAEVQRRHDLVIVSFHAGAEGSVAGHVPKGPESFYGESRGDVYAFAHSLVDAGADLLLGHGPHRLRGVEIYRGRLIAYSLGNFSTWNTFSLEGPLAISTVLRTTLAPNGVALAAELKPVVIAKPGQPRLDPKGEAIRMVRELSRQDFGAELFDQQGKWQRP